MRVLCLCLLLTPVLAFADSATTDPPASSPLALTVEVVPRQPLPGQRVYWLARLRNASNQTVYLPADTLGWMYLSSTFMPPDAPGGLSSSRRSRTLSVAVTEWQPLGPGAALEKAGELGDDVEACRGGCRAGTVIVLVGTDSVRAAMGAALAADHLLPAGLTASVTVQIASPPAAVFPVIERRAVDAVTLTVLGVRAVKHQMRARVRLENRTSQPMWVRRVDKMTGFCDLEAQGIGRPGSVGGSPIWEANDVVLLPPGHGLEGEVACGTPLPRGGSVRVTLSPSSPSNPAIIERHQPLEPPFLWTGSVQSESFSFGASTQRP